jgi:phage replication-related protein YjqB (UPF0714/DUF867 family)
VNPEQQQLRARVVADSHGYAKIVIGEDIVMTGLDKEIAIHMAATINAEMEQPDDQ